jgi:hypothetical protein
MEDLFILFNDKKNTQIHNDDDDDNNNNNQSTTNK